MHNQEFDRLYGTFSFSENKNFNSNAPGGSSQEILAYLDLQFSYRLSRQRPTVECRPSGVGSKLNSGPQLQFKIHMLFSPLQMPANVLIGAAITICKTETHGDY